MRWSGGSPLSSGLGPTFLGLFVTRKLVTDHGGAIAFASRPGQGTTFEVRLPLPVEGPRTLPALSPAVAAGGP